MHLCGINFKSKWALWIFYQHHNEREDQVLNDYLEIEKIENCTKLTVSDFKNPNFFPSINLSKSSLNSFNIPNMNFTISWILFWRKLNYNFHFDFSSLFYSKLYSSSKYANSFIYLSLYFFIFEKIFHSLLEKT